MSAGRKYRRRAERWIWRQPGVEMSAKTRELVGRLVRAHDDEAVTMAQYFELCQEASAYLLGLPEAERMEACAVIGDRALEALTGRRLRTVAIERRPS